MKIHLWRKICGPKVSFNHLLNMTLAMLLFKMANHQGGIHKGFYYRIQFHIFSIENGPEGLRSLGSPVMSRLLYQAELRAPKQRNFFSGIKCYEISSILHNNYQATNFVPKLICLQLQSSCQSQ